MQEIVQIQVGQCGNRVGERFWDMVCEQHGVLFRDDDGGSENGESDIRSHRRDVFFDESDNGSFVPRSVFVDLDPDSLADVKNGGLSDIFRPDCFVGGTMSAGNCFARAYLGSEGANLIEQVMEAVRRETERCDCLQGFQVVRSIGGGTGSGVGTLLLEKLREEYRSDLFSSHIVFPSPTLADAAVEPYNALLAASYLIELDDMTFCYDNDAVRANIARGYGEEAFPSKFSVNYTISRAMSGVTSGHRFSGDSKTDLLKFYLNTTIYPRHHFHLPGLHLFSPEGQIMEDKPPALPHIFEPSLMLATCDPRMGRCFSVAACVEGGQSPLVIKDELTRVRREYGHLFADYVPDSLFQTDCKLVSEEPSVTLALNTTAISAPFENLLGKFERLVDKKAFMHMYIGEGMEEINFAAAANDARGLISDLKRFHTTSDEQPNLNETDSGRQNEEPNEAVVENGTKKFWFF